ncbi:MAG: hypothetical protein RQ801_11245, partial [Spirochaetaceae bacterium]|nr:hypothetical protein [Spirochaetaceae bacterium]
MSLSAFRNARAETRRFLDRNGVVDHMFHGPSSDRYWTEPFKAVAINMEAYGYRGCGRYEVDRETLIDWLYDAGSTDTRTTRYTLAILAVLLKRMEESATADWAEMQRAYADADRLEATLDRTVYFNIRPETNIRKQQDFDAIAGVGNSPIGALLWNEIIALDPDVLIV